MTKLTVYNSEKVELSSQELPDFDCALTIGRFDDCNIILPDGDISRHHAQLILKAGEIFIEDTKSTRGTFVNGRRITDATKVVPGDCIQLGGSTLLLGELPIQPGASGQPSAVLRPVVQQMPSQVAAQQLPSPQAAQPVLNGQEEEKGRVEKLVDEFDRLMVLYEPGPMALIQAIHAEVVRRSNAEGKKGKPVSSEEEQQRALELLDEVLLERQHEIPQNILKKDFRQALKDEITDLGPLAPLVRSDIITEIMVNGPDTVFIEVKDEHNKSHIINSHIHFFNEKHLISIIQRIVEKVGRRVDDASPMVDARLADGSRVNAIIPPLVLQGAALTIRKFSDKKLTTDDLIGYGSMTKEMALFLEAAVKARQNILVSGGTGSGKTTLLNVLSQFIPLSERVITVEDSAELKLDHPNLLSLEARPASAEGTGRVTIRDLVINTLRMRPDRIIVGECRGAEALDMLQAMNTGHDGSMTTAHANSPKDALSRLETMVMMAGFELPSRAIREQIASAVNLVVQQTRLEDGSRKIVQISEVTGREEDTILMQDIFKFEKTDVKNKDGKVTVEGFHTATGNIPKFIEEQNRAGTLELDMDVFVPKN
ncbi:MAG: Flp pilus assembly complex ATPase component TadA [Victivallales bacterium]|nr:Flp pilus assembly complex ATPase component TadA [Victivallales bacterium]